VEQAEGHEVRQPLPRRLGGIRPASGGPLLQPLLRVRTIFRIVIDVRVGIGPSIMVAATACAQMPSPGGVLAVWPDEVATWLGLLPVDAFV
jgi:hypothetical protein